jgi:hypothetical protein
MTLLTFPASGHALVKRPKLVSSTESAKPNTAADEESQAVANRAICPAKDEIK